MQERIILNVKKNYSEKKLKKTDVTNNSACLSYHLSFNDPNN